MDQPPHLLSGLTKQSLSHFQHLILAIVNTSQCQTSSRMNVWPEQQLAAVSTGVSKHFKHYTTSTQYLLLPLSILF
jgi:hypothetical protein